MESGYLSLNSENSKEIDGKLGILVRFATVSYLLLWIRTDFLLHVLFFHEFGALLVLMKMTNWVFFVLLMVSDYLCVGFWICDV